MYSYVESGALRRKRDVNVDVLNTCIYWLLQIKKSYRYKVRKQGREFPQTVILVITVLLTPT